MWFTVGYSPLHCSAMWGQLDTLKTLVELNADFQATNFRGEKAVDVARRYDKLDCVEYLAWAGEKRKNFRTQNLFVINLEDFFSPNRGQTKFTSINTRSQRHYW